MSARVTGLSELLVGSISGSVKSGSADTVVARPTVSGLICGVLRKSAAPGIVTNRILPKDYEANMAKAEQQQAQASRQAQAARESGKYSLTGNSYYDNLPDVKRRRAKYEQAYAEYARRNPSIVKRKSRDEIMREVDAGGPTKSWGDSTVGNWFGRVIGAPAKLLADAVGSNVGYLMSPKGTSYGEYMKTYYDNANKDWDTLGHDIANNFQLQANSLGHGAAQLARTAGEYLDPTSYGNSTAARNRKMSYRNTRANADQAFLERQNRIVNNFEMEDLRRPEKSVLGMLNYGGNTAVGQFAGEAAVTMGAGSAARGVGQGLTKGTHALSGVIRGASTAGSAGRSVGSRVVSGARNMLANGVDAMGETVAMPFNTAGGVLADPIGSLDKGVRRGIPTVYRGVRQTVGAGIGRPVRGMYNFARHPIESIGATVRHPIQAGGSVVRWGRDTFSPAMRVAFSKPAWQAETVYDMARNAYNGDYAGAAGSLGTMGVYGGAGNWALPAMILHGMYSGGGGDGDDYGGYPAGQGQ